MASRHAIRVRPARRGLSARPLEPRDRPAALERLRRSPRDNLLLIDMVHQLGAPPLPGEDRTDIMGVWRDGELCGVAATRPTVVFEAGLDMEVVGALLPCLAGLRAGLVKSRSELVEAIWPHIVARATRALIDRTESVCVLERGDFEPVEPQPGTRARDAVVADLPDLVHAARESLREEGRPDPFQGDPHGFRRWVRGRVSRARVLECEGRTVFVGYADVRRPEGWLLQGIYTWPEQRRRGFGTAGVSDLCRLALGSGAGHVQLSVVEGNRTARRVYERVGFHTRGRVRTILFA